MRTLLIFSLLYIFNAQAYVYIDVGRAQIRQSQIALQPLILTGSTTPKIVQAGSLLFKTLQSNLSTLGMFKLISQEAFLESAGAKAFEPYPKDPNGFIWKNWQILNADYLILGKYQIVDDSNTLHVDMYLYSVPLKRKIFQKQYTSQLNTINTLAHTIGNDIAKSLTHKPGIFLTKIVASRSMSGTKKELFIMRWNGKDKKQISFHQSTVLSPSWSNNGRYIAYTAFLYSKRKKKRNAALILYNRLQNSRRILSNRLGENLGSDFLPDGKSMLASLFLNRGYMDIAKISLLNSSITPITSGPNGSINVEPVIHPNGKTVLFSSDRGGGVMLYSMNIDGGNIKRLTYQGSYNSTPDYSPDGKQVVFSGYSKGRSDIFIMNADGSNTRHLTSLKKKNNTWANNESPSFSPNGQFIVFSGNQTGKYQLYIMNIASSQIQQITNDNYNYKSPKWSPFL